MADEDVMVDDPTAYDKPSTAPTSKGPLAYGYNAGLPPHGFDAAWGARCALEFDHLTGTRRVVMVPDPQSTCGSRLARATLVDILNDGVTTPQWRATANRALHTGLLQHDRAGPMVLLNTTVVTVVADSQASLGWLYVCAYTQPAVDGTSLAAPEHVLPRDVTPGCYVYREAPDGRHGGWYPIVDSQRHAGTPSGAPGVHYLRFDRPHRLRNEIANHYMLSPRTRETIRRPHPPADTT